MRIVIARRVLVIQRVPRTGLPLEIQRIEILLSTAKTRLELLSRVKLWPMVCELARSVQASEVSMVCFFVSFAVLPLMP